MTTYASATDFVVKALNYRDGERASTLKSVVAWLLTVSGDGHYDDQLTNLERWAIQAEPADYISEDLLLEVSSIYVCCLVQIQRSLIFISAVTLVRTLDIQYQM
jgi:hypothetical protein